MKEYSFEEVIANIKNGETYKCNESGYVVKTIYRSGSGFRFNNNELMDFCGINNMQRFIKVETPVSFMEALTSDKRCSVKSEIISKVYNKCSDRSSAQVDIIKNVLDGKFDYINSIIYGISGYMGGLDWEDLIKNGEFYLESEEE